MEGSNRGEEIGRGILPELSEMNESTSSCCTLYTSFIFYIE